MTILLVDDDPVIVLAAVAGLEAGGHRVLRAGSATEALAWLATETPDLFLLDARLEETDGAALLGRLREAGATSIPAIFLTALTDPTALQGLQAAGAVGVLRKPFDPFALAGDVEALLAAGSAR